MQTCTTCTLILCDRTWGEYFPCFCLVEETWLGLCKSLHILFCFSLVLPWREFKKRNLISSRLIQIDSLRFSRIATTVMVNIRLGARYRHKTIIRRRHAYLKNRFQDLYANSFISSSVLLSFTNAQILFQF